MNRRQLDTLIDMHTYCRPANSRTERQFIRRYIAPLPGAAADPWGNWHVTIGAAPTILFSCHTDTVHQRGGRQRIRLADGILTLDAPGRSTCLGADDSAGVFLCREMIRRGIPGHYVFHNSEEIGCLGSRALAADPGGPLEGIRAAVAFDRGGHTDVITHQCGRRTCSEDFAGALAAALGHGYQPSDRGIYTDTREYADLVPECTNVSVGYTGAHSPAEALDVAHVGCLLAAVCALDWTRLPIARTPAPEALDDWPDTWPPDDRPIDRDWPREFLEADWQAIDDAIESLRRDRHWRF